MPTAISEISILCHRRNVCEYADKCVLAYKTSRDGERFFPIVYLGSYDHDNPQLVKIYCDGGAK